MSETRTLYVIEPCEPPCVHGNEEPHQSLVPATVDDLIAALDVEAFSAVLHHKLCTRNHIDGCSFYYEGKWGEAKRTKWVEQATALLAALGEHDRT